MTATAVLGKADYTEHRMQPTAGRDRPEPDLHRTSFLLFLGVGDHHLKLRSPPGLQITFSERQTNFLKSYFQSGKARENFTRSVCLSIFFFFNFSWPHEYKHMKAQQNQNWIHILNLAVCCHWILTSPGPRPYPWKLYFFLKATVIIHLTGGADGEMGKKNI